MKMSRFQQELSGQLGEFWRKDAEKELNRVREDIKVGNITIDSKGVARNKIGRVVMADMLEKILIVTDLVDEEATRAARDEEVHKEIEEYRRNYTGPSAEELAEMRAAFGKGTRVVNLFTGTRIQL